MIESHLEQIVHKFAGLVERVERLEIGEEESISKLKAKLRLSDATILYIKEIWINEKVDAYSYYWLRPDETLIIGWDNAPHHREIISFPHHKHVGDKIEISQERNLEDVLRFIKTFLG